MVERDVRDGRLVKSSRCRHDESPSHIFRSNMESLGNPYLWDIPRIHIYIYIYIYTYIYIYIQYIYIYIYIYIICNESGNFQICVLCIVFLHRGRWCDAGFQLGHPQAGWCFISWTIPLDDWGVALWLTRWCPSQWCERWFIIPMNTIDIYRYDVNVGL